MKHKRFWIRVDSGSCRSCPLIQPAEISWRSSLRSTIVLIRHFAVLIILSHPVCSTRFGGDPSSSATTPHANHPAKQVNLAGDFNGWSKVATPMNDEGGGTFVATIDLSEGIHQYKFVVDGEKWMNDPHGDRKLEVDDNSRRQELRGV